MLAQVMIKFCGTSRRFKVLLAPFPLACLLKQASYWPKALSGSLGFLKKSKNISRFHSEEKENVSRSSARPLTTVGDETHH